MDAMLKSFRASACVVALLVVHVSVLPLIVISLSDLRCSPLASFLQATGLTHNSFC